MNLEYNFVNSKTSKVYSKKIIEEISMCLQQNGCRAGNNVYIALYLLFKAFQYNNPYGISVEMIAKGDIDINENVRLKAKELFTKDTWKKLLEIGGKYAPESLKIALVYPVNETEIKGRMTTPDSILKLVHKILDVKPDERVADICCGKGAYINYAACIEKDACYYGCETNPEETLIAQLRAEMFYADIKIENKDAFSLAESGRRVKFDKIFSNYPFGVKVKNIEVIDLFLEHLFKEYPAIPKTTSSDWIFNAMLYDLLDHNGKAVGIMTNGSTWNSTDTPMRKYFVESGMIESVISLPNKMFSSTNILTTMIVLSHGNKGIRMVDATKFYQPGRRQNEFSNEDIENIIIALSEDSEYSKLISLEELRENEYNLSLKRYIEGNFTFNNGGAFESVIKRISRGAPCTASQLDEMVSENPTNMQYLMLANIQNGMIDDKLPYLSYIDPKYEKYCLKNNSLILSKNGYPYKAAVAQVKEGQQILANGNLYMIELDESKIDPYYLKAFFESEKGNAVLKSITVGASIPNIGVDKLKKVEIPIPPMEEQKLIAEKYQATLVEIADIKLQLDRAVKKLSDIFDDEQ